MSGRLIYEWRHLFKLDPDKTLSDEALEALCLSGTDAVVVGGSSGVTYDNVIDLLARLRRYETPCALEVTDLQTIVPGFDLYLVPIVLNTTDPDYIIRRHQQAMKMLGSLTSQQEFIAEAYIIANPDCTAARVASAQQPLTDADILAYGRVADQLMRIPIIYLEYSGAFGSMSLLHELKRVVRQARIFYGGGIDHEERARLASEAADTIVVGNVIYESLERALSTVQAVNKDRKV
jgi:putative glycerol-1-phosphate prenyltransferase